MEEFRRVENAASDEKFKADRPDQLDEPAYPASIEEMSERWRAIRRQTPDQQNEGFVERHYLALGVGIGLLIIAFLIVIGGFAFLVWNAR